MTGVQTCALPISLYSNPLTLEVYPIPSSNYSVSGYIRREIKDFKDIPEVYQDVLIDYATLAVHALINSSLAMKLAKEGLMDVQNDSLTSWTGNVVSVNRSLDMKTNRVESDSHNLRGE